MKFEVMSVYDNKARIFLAPFTCVNISVAVRSFTEAANTPEMMPCKHPEDFMLFHIGRWDDDTGMTESLNPPINLGMAAHFKDFTKNV